MADKAKIAVLVSGGGTNLQALIDAQKSGIINNGEIVLVISNVTGAYALERAKTAGIDSFTVSTILAFSLSKNSKSCSMSSLFAFTE